MLYVHRFCGLGCRCLWVAIIWPIKPWKYSFSKMWLTTSDENQKSSWIRTEKCTLVWQEPRFSANQSILILVFLYIYIYIPIHKLTHILHLKGFIPWRLFWAFSIYWSFQEWSLIVFIFDIFNILLCPYPSSILVYVQWHYIQKTYLFKLLGRQT